MASDNTAVATRTKWLALLSGFLGWSFDSMDLNLFTLVLFPSVGELIGSTDPGRIASMGAYIIAIKLLFWGMGGIVFGVVADHIGRTRTMVITIVIYSVFTGLSGFAQSWGQLAFFQAVAGLGIGGEWAAGAALVAEIWPEKHRAKAMQVMQMGFAAGFFLAAIDNVLLGPLSWRYVLMAGALPALVALFIRMFVPESERWKQVRERNRASRPTMFQTFAAVFAPDVRRRTIVGVLISASMMIGSWGGLTMMPSWIQGMVRASGGAPVAGVHAISNAFMLMMAGAILGYLLLVFLSDAIGRRWCYFLFGIGALWSSLWLFLTVDSLSGLMAFMPVYGFFVIGGFGTFAAYLPELFRTQVRATGPGFCWNFARILTAIGPLIAGSLVGILGSPQMAAASTVGFYLVGIVAIWFGPETRGVSLQD